MRRPRPRAAPRSWRWRTLTRSTTARSRRSSAEDDADVEDDTAADDDDTFLEEEEEDDGDVSDLIDGDIEEDDER